MILSDMSENYSRLHFTVVTLFPNLVSHYLSEALLAKAIKNRLFDVTLVPLRDFAEGTYKSVDDTPCGGGDGMVMRADILEKALLSVLTQKQSASSRSVVIYLSPQGQVWNSDLAKKMLFEWSSGNSQAFKSARPSLVAAATEIESLNEKRQTEVILICGRYAGVDQRFLSKYVDQEISIGDYVLSGGELAALVLIESVARYIPGVLGAAESSKKDSFEDHWLECPQFTRPIQWSGLQVPEMLSSGHHAHIEQWRKYCSYLVTLKKRPDLFAQKWSSLGLSIQVLQKFYSLLPDADKKILQIEDLMIEEL